MAYDSNGRRPFERASRSSHHHIINDEQVQALLSKSWIPGSEPLNDLDFRFASPNLANIDAIEHIITVDGSYAEVVVRPSYPSSTVGFMQFGALSFRRSDLARLEESPHPAPEDMQKIRNLERLKLAVPLRGLRIDKCGSLVQSVRLSIIQFFRDARIENVSLADTLAWIIFELYRKPEERPDSWHLASNPTTADWSGIDLTFSMLRSDFVFASESDGNELFLTDVLRLHEKIDEETGASGIVGHLLSAVEQVIIIHVMRLIHRQQPGALRRCLFLRDGPLAFFGQTAPLYAPVRRVLAWFREATEVNLVGLEKSGAFVEHARQIEARIPFGSALILNDDYIYRFIIPKEQSSADIYGRNTYYGRKIIYRTRTGGTHVATLPTNDAIPAPTTSDLIAFDTVLSCIDDLRCDMYDSALIPVALANKLVSLSAHPSQRILQRFALGSVRGQG